MAHVAKYTRSSIGGLTSHFERRQDENGDYYKFKNQDIDFTRTQLNYNLAENIDQREFIKKRLSEVKCLNRGDVKVMCSWVVTAPKNLPKSDEQQFFMQSYNFLKNRYGENNVISSYVHLDEVTPHMHFAFIPVVKDKRTNKEKVSAKECINKRDLQTFHKDLDNHMFKTFGYDIGILNGATKNGNMAIDELKRNSAEKQIEEIKEITKRNIIASQNCLEDAKNEALKIIQNSSLKADKININIKYLEQDKNMLQEQITAYKSMFDTFEAIDKLGKSNILGKVIFTVDESNKLKEQAKSYFYEKVRANEADLKNKNIKKSAIYEENIKLKENIKELSNRIYGLKKINQEMNFKINKINKIFSRNPTLAAAFEKAIKDMQQEEKKIHNDMDYER